MIRTLNRIIPTALRAFQTPVARPLLRSLMTDTRATALKPSLWGAQRSMGLPNNGRWGTTLPRFVSTTATLAPLTPKAHYERAIAKGKPLGDFRDWRIRTAGADVSFKTEGNGQVWPALVLEKITFVDPKPRDLIQENLQNFTHVTTLEELNDVIVKLIQTESPYLRVTDTKSKALNENHGITNLRRQAFIRALRESALGQTQLSPSDRVKALGVIETTNLKLATGRNYVMKVGSHTNYWPYWKNYIPPLVRLLEQHKEGDPGWHQIKNRISDILRRKTAHNRTLDEKDIEKTMNLALVMRPMFSNNMGHRVSMAKDSTTFNPKYELLSIAKTGLPEGFEEYAGIQLVREEQGTIRVDFMS